MDERAEMLKSNLPGMVKSCKYQKVSPLSPIQKCYTLAQHSHPIPLFLHCFSSPPLCLPTFVPFSVVFVITFFCHHILSSPLFLSYFVITFVVIILLNNKIYCHLSCLHGCSHAWSSCALSSASFLLEKTIFTPPEVPSAQSPSA